MAETTTEMRYYAAIAEQGGASPELDRLIFAPASIVETGDRFNVSEGITVILEEQIPSK